MLLRVGPQLKPISSYRRIRHRDALAPIFWGIADQGGSLVDATDNQRIVSNGGAVTVGAGARGPALKYGNSTSIYSSVPLTPPPGLMTLVVAFQTGTIAAVSTLAGWNNSSNGSNSTNDRVLYANSSGTLTWYVYNGSSQTTTTTTTYTDGKLHVAHAVIDGTHLKIYVDGGIQATGNTNVSNGYNSYTTPYLGTGSFRSNQGGSNYGGLIDSISVYNYALTPSQVLADYLDPWWRLRRRRSPGFVPTAIKYIQSASNSYTTSLTGRTLAYGSNVTAGDCLIAVIGTTLAATLTVTDSLGQTWSQAGTYSTVTAGVSASIWYFPNTAGGACTLTVTPSLSIGMAIAIHEYSGVALTSPLNSTATANGTSATPSSGSCAASANQLIVTGYTQATGIEASATIASPFTLRQSILSNVNLGIGSADDVAVTGALTPTFTVSSALTVWAAISASFALPSAATIYGPWPMASWPDLSRVPWTAIPY